MRALIQTLAVLMLAPSIAAATAPEQVKWNISSSQQMVLVITPDWESPVARLQAFERDNDRWLSVTKPFDVTVGKNGSAWGLGLHEAQTDGPMKVEGDGKAPAGIFAIGDAFGYAGSIDSRLPYQAMNASDWCIDVNDSPLYNRIVSTDEVGIEAVKGSSEPMRRDIHLNGDPVYGKGFIIGHNPGNVPKGGSCIFAHLWRAPGVPTAGCTAMPEPDMDALLAWLDAGKHPLFVLLPESEYRRLRQSWQLPELNP